MTTLRPLTPKQSTFVAEYIKTQSSYKAALAAGYSKHTASVQGRELLTKPHVVKAIADFQREGLARTHVDLDQLVREMWAIAEDIEQPGAVRVSAIVHTGKMLGIYVETKNVNVAGHVTHSAMSELTIDELKVLVERGKDDIQALPPGENTEALEGEYQSIDGETPDSELT